MRIAQVSAHYPPNFVSGGTLVPQRIARRIAAAGHESFVFAGYLDESRDPLDTWDELDDAGVHVTWLVTTPWTAWTDPMNYDNPQAAAAFSTWLDRVRPDVVHVHSLQTLGVGLIEAARAARVPVVLTMHDFWWFCVRQFLVDEEMRPCSLVPECGSCSCAAAPGPNARATRLREALADVDVVLAPSHSAARVFLANGVEPERLRVDENGLPDDQLDLFAGGPVARRGNGPLRLMYAGGTQSMKGFDVLRTAARMIGPRADLVLNGYGVDAAAAGAIPQWFHPRPAFAPEDLMTTLEAHDVLVLPSVMRESHSILTREALAAGLAVVCTDTLGPEEAVTHGVNGQVIPAGDEASLAEVITTLADDPSAARNLTGHGSSSPIRRFSDQADGLLRIYKELGELRGDQALAPVDGDASVQPDIREAQRQLLDRVLFVIGIDGAPLRYRAHLPAEALRLRGHQVTLRHYRDPELLADIGTADAVVFYRVPATVQVLDLIERIRSLPHSVPVLYDVDDLIFDSNLRGELDGLASLPQAEQDLWWHGVDRYRTSLEACDGFIGSTQALCDYATSLTGLPSYRFPNGVGQLLAQASDTALRHHDGERSHSVSIGYFSGTTTHDADWASVEPAVVAVMRRHPEVVLKLGGHLKPTPALTEFGPRVRQLPFTQWSRLPELLVGTDICLAPLTGGSIFNESKSAIKWLEAALVARPTIASPTEPFREVIEDGRTGFLAESPAQWEHALETLIMSRAARARIGAAARREALVRFSPRVQGRMYEDLLVDAALHLREHGRRAEADWVPVADDEPYSTADAVVEAYGLSTRPALLQGVSRVRHWGRRAAAVARDEGLGSLARRARRKVKRRLAR